MSAFVVNKSHINAMLLKALHPQYGGHLSWYLNGQHHELTNDNIDQVGQMLLDENVKSVCCRYEDSEVTDLPGGVNADYLIPFKTKYLHRIPSALETIKLIHCYSYQSCEHPEWEISEAKAFCQSLESEAISQLPGYDDAPWEWEDLEYYETAGLTRLT